MRVGQGYDVHALSDGLPLIIGGVKVPFLKGLVGHSDADVLLHAICDCLLGASALKDIGTNFPDTDLSFQDIDSRIILRRVRDMVERAGFQILNIDSTIIAQKPILRPFIPEMIQNISGDLGIQTNRVSVKAKTSEKLGYLGRAEGIAAQAICLLR
tara:strand:+ start:235 stop:702 length:468 start_codon:yes stop_codon:yes gene_type:complete